MRVSLVALILAVLSPVVAAELPSTDSEAVPVVRPISRGKDHLRFPPAAIQKGVAGKVVCRLTYDATGVVTDVSIVSEEPAGFGFGEAAAKHVRQWTFPAGVAGTYRTTIKFCALPGVITIGQQLPEPPPAQSKVDPIYPSAALAAHIGGAVTAEMTVDCWGDVGVVITSETPPGMGFGESVSLALRAWVYTPSDKGTYQLTFNFTPP